LKAKGIDVGKPGKADKKEEAKKVAANPANKAQHTSAQGGSGNPNGHEEPGKASNENKSNPNEPPKLSKAERHANFVTNNPNHVKHSEPKGIEVGKPGKADKKEAKKAAAQAANNPGCEQPRLRTTHSIPQVLKISRESMRRARTTIMRRDLRSCLRNSEKQQHRRRRTGMATGSPDIFKELPRATRTDPPGVTTTLMTGNRLPTRPQN
jgi:hypothetical protein